MFNGRETTYSQETVENNGFFGSVNVGDFQKQRSIPLQISLEMTKAVLVYAVQTVERNLAMVADKYRKQGIRHAEDIMDSPFINGKNYQQVLFEKAVFARAKAELLPEFATLSARDLHEKRDLVKEQKSLLTEAVQAIRELKGKGRGSVALL